MASIHDACKEGDFNSVIELLNSDPSLVHSLDESSNTPLHCAAMFGHTRIIALLIEKGADVNQQNSGGDTAEGIARRRGYDDLARRLRDLDFPPVESSFPLGAEVDTPSVGLSLARRGDRVSAVANGIAAWGLALLWLNILGAIAVSISALQGDSPLTLIILVGGCITAFVVRAVFTWASEVLKTLGDIAGYKS